MVAAQPTLAVYATVYPGVERFLPSWRESVENQVDADFDLWIGLDAVTPEEAKGWMGGAIEPSFSPAQPGDTPARVRERAIRKIVDRYDMVVFVDSDDELLPERIGSARSALETYDVAGCALRIIDEDGRDTGARFGARSDTDWADFLLRYNVFGMSNTAYRARVLARCLPLPADGILVDWLMATRAAMSGARVGFDETPLMKYRQYGGNTAKVLPPFSPDDIRRAADRVADHYRGLLESDWRVPEAYAARLSGERDRVASFRGAMGASESLLAEYASRLNRLEPRHVWWWCVAHPDLECMWQKN